MHGVAVHCVSRKSRKTADCNPPCLVSFRGCMEANHAPRRISVNALFFPGVSRGSAGWWRASTVLVVEEGASTSLEKTVKPYFVTEVPRLGKSFKNEIMEGGI